MRLILTTIILTMLAQPVWAKTSLQLYEECKPYANNGYSLTGLDQMQQSSAIACTAFQSGIIHHAYLVCTLADDPVARELFGTSITSTKVLTQMFLNWAEENPDKWEYTAFPPNWIKGTCEEK